MIKAPVAWKQAKLFKNQTGGVDIHVLDEEFNFARILDTGQEVESGYEEEELKTIGPLFVWFKHMLENVRVWRSLISHRGLLDMETSFESKVTENDKLPSAYQGPSLLSCPSASKKENLL